MLSFVDIFLWNKLISGKTLLFLRYNGLHPLHYWTMCYVLHCFCAANQIVISSLHVTLLLQEFFQEKVKSTNLTTIQNAWKTPKTRSFFRMCPFANKANKTSKGIQKYSKPARKHISDYSNSSVTLLKEEY